MLEGGLCRESERPITLCLKNTSETHSGLQTGALPSVLGDLACAWACPPGTTASTMPAVPHWRAGVSKVCITPTEPICLDGWGSRISQGVSMDIWVKAAAFAAGEGGAPHVLVSADLCGFSGSMTERLVEWVAQNHGMARSQLILNCSHNHSGPVFEDTLPLYHNLNDTEYEVIARYTEELEAKVHDAISKAIAALVPCTLAWGQSLCGLAVNRRRSRGGETRRLPTVVDQDVPVLTLRGNDGSLFGVLFGYSCHATAINDQKVTMRASALLLF
jgi:neutral ceramidase